MWGFEHIQNDKREKENNNGIQRSKFIRYHYVVRREDQEPMKQSGENKLREKNQRESRVRYTN